MLQSLITALDGFGVGRRAQMLLLGGVGIALLWGVYSWATAPTWVPAYSGVELADAARITARLDEDGITHRLERGGSEILVPSDELIDARIALAEEGVPTGRRPGLELFDRPSWGMTDFAQRVNYRRALEGELERTIAQMAGVDDVKVHLALQETSAFRRSDQPAEASVVLTTSRGADPSTNMVRGITYLVASSVDQLTSEHVTVVGANGRVLSASTESEGGAALSSRQMEAQRELERHLEEQATRVLSPIVGPENVDVRVAATLNFDQLARTVQAVDPDAQIVTGEERSEIIPSEGATGAASVQSSTTFDGTRSVEQFTQGQGGVERLTVAVLVNARAVDDGTGTTVEDRTADEIRQIESLVANAVGIDADRGDQLSVVSVPFTVTPGVDIPADGLIGVVFEWLQMLQKPVLSVLGLLLMFFVALRLMRTLKEMPAPELLPAGATAGSNATGRGLPSGTAAVGPGGPTSGLGMPAGPSDGLGFGGGAPTYGGTAAGNRQQIAARVVEDPQTAARAAGQWLRGN